MINTRAAQDEEAATICQALWVGRPHDKDFEIFDLDTGLPVSADTKANGTRSAVDVNNGEELRDAATEAAPAQTGKAEVARHKRDEEFEILDI